MKILGYAKLERLSRVGGGRLRRRSRTAGLLPSGNPSSRTLGSGVRLDECRRSELGRESSVRETGGGRIVLYRSLPPISLTWNPVPRLGYNRGGAAAMPISGRRTTRVNQHSSG